MEVIKIYIEIKLKEALKEFVEYHHFIDEKMICKLILLQSGAQRIYIYVKENVDRK